jgi:hypothetical protein
VYIALKDSAFNLKKYPSVYGLQFTVCMFYNRRMSTVTDSLKALQTIPNIGPSLAKDLCDLGFREPKDLKKQDPVAMYKKLCRQTGERQDPCVLDTFMAAVHFADTGEARKWWSFTPERKAHERNLKACAK